MSRSSILAIVLVSTLALASCGGSGDAAQSGCSLNNLPSCGGGTGSGGGGGGGGGDPGGGPPPPTGGDPSAQVGSVVLVFGSTELGSAGIDGEEVTVTALVRTAANTALSGVRVEFGVDSGILSVVTPVTDAAGRSVARLGTSGDKSNRTITVTARAGTQQASAPVAVAGTHIELVGPDSIPLGASASYEATVLDSAGRPVPFAPVAFTSHAGNVLSASPVVTDSRGRATVGLTASRRGDDIFAASAMGAQAVQALRVLADDITLTPAVTYDGSGAEIMPQAMLGACTAINGRSEVSSTGSVSFATSRGRLYSDAACAVPLAGSVAFATADVPAVYLGSDSPGIATIDALLAGGGSGSTRIELVAPLTASATVDLQSSLAVVGSGEPADLIAIVRDGTPGNNLVKGAPVTFSIVSDPSGGTLHAPLTVATGSDGVARATFTGGPAGSPRDGVTLQASLAAPSSSISQTTMTVSRKALSIQFGTGNDLVEYSPATLQQDFAIFVTDASGNPVPGAALRAAAWPVLYRKGNYVWQPEVPPALRPGVWVPDLSTAFECANEDAARAGIYDSAFDTNQNGLLEPGIPLSVSVGATSDANGMATVSLRYPRDRASWLRVELTVTGNVSGTESLARHTLWLQPLAEDLQDPYVSPPGQSSPYGVEACTSAN